MNRDADRAQGSAGAARPPATRAAAFAEQWNLDDLYPDRAAFDAARAGLRERLGDLPRFRGTLGRSGRALAEGLDAVSEVRRELGRLHAYASTLSDSDLRDARTRAAREEIELLWNEYSRTASFVRPEILELDPSRIEEFLAGEPALAPHRHPLKSLVRQREHVLGPAEERILAEAGLITGGAGSLFGILNDAELPRPRIEVGNEGTVELTPATFARLRSTPDRTERRRIFEAYFGAYETFRRTLGQNLFQGVKAHLFRARSRGYPSCLAAALDGENIPVGVYHNLIREVRSLLPLLHRYFRMRARALGGEVLEYHDLHCPLVREEPRRYTPEESQRLLTAALEPLGEGYRAGLARAFAERWIDWHPRPGKRSGAYATGAAYDVHPYVLLNWNGDYESVSTVAHELGHAMHSFFSNREQPYPTADYSIFVAEVASTFNEALLNSSLLQGSRAPEERLFLLGTYLDGLRATLFRQTMFAEFELAIHERAERGEALTGEILDEMYLALLRDYHGHDAGVMRIDDAYAVEWAAIPHFHYNFYVYQYSTGIVAATALAESVRGGEPGARERYLRFLASGGSDYSLELLRGAGVDLERPEPYRATARAMTRKLDQLETLLPG